MRTRAGARARTFGNGKGEGVVWNSLLIWAARESAHTRVWLGTFLLTGWVSYARLHRAASRLAFPHQSTRWCQVVDTRTVSAMLFAPLGRTPALAGLVGLMQSRLTAS